MKNLEVRYLIWYDLLQILVRKSAHEFPLLRINCNMICIYKFTNYKQNLERECNSYM